MKKPAPDWMLYVLVVGGLYNLVWGFFTIIFPNAVFEFAGIAPPLYPELWQCIGMIVGLYGLAYLFAATDPYRYWPIVLVGLLGKIFGPIGFVKALATGSLPLEFAYTILFNDLIWWAPFFLIVKAALKEETDEKTLSIESALRSSRTYETKLSLHESIRDKTALLIFLRHRGCSLCRQLLADFSKIQKDIVDQGIQVVFVHQSEESAGPEFIQTYGIKDYYSVSDPDRALHKAFNFGKICPTDLLSPKAWIVGLRAAFIEGHGIGPLDGDGFQADGFVLMKDGKLIQHKSFSLKEGHKLSAFSESIKSSA